jgi:predicted Rossmann fold flavoprotein
MDDSDATWDVVVVGAGAAGLMAAATAAFRGRRTLLLEKNRKPGVKILMSGGTRCNVTQATDNAGIVAQFGRQGRFLHSALAALGVDETIALFEAEGLATKVESTGKIFPASDRATDVLAALLRRLTRSGATLALDEPLCQVDRAENGFLLRTSKRAVNAARLLITSGGQSYPGCGTIGEGYVWARQFGHTIISPRPALVPLTTDAPWVRELRGITVPDVALRVVESSDQSPRAAKARPLAERRGSFLFTHFGLSGPVVLDVSRAVSGHANPRSLVLECDFLPSITADELNDSLARQAAAEGKKQLVSLLGELLPRRLSEALLSAAGLSPTQKAAEAGAAVRARTVDAIKRTAIPLSGTCGFKKAEVTAGGVALDEVDSRTMQSKLAANVYLAGEVLDLDGPIGGYNFQAAWSTGFLAGESV